MPPRKKPHPRSLDALFGPKPRTIPKAAVKRCVRGHRQATSWKPGGICTACCVEEETRLRRAAPLPPLGPVPAFLTTLIVSTGRRLTHSIPPHMQRRGPGRRRRV